MASRDLRTGIAFGREVKGPIEGDEAGLIANRHSGGVQPFDQPSVSDDDEFDVWVTGCDRQIARAFLRSNRGVGRNDDRNTGRVSYSHSYPIGGWIFNYFSIEPSPLHCVRQGRDVCFSRLWFASARPRSGVLP